MTKIKTSSLKLFYDGECYLCFHEVNHYKKNDKDNSLILVDISHPDFDAQKYQLDPHQVKVNMHSMDESGKLFVGVDTFLEIWRRIKPYHLLVPIINNKVIRPLADISYRIFADHIRPKLPKRKCNNDRCQL